MDFLKTIPLARQLYAMAAVIILALGALIAYEARGISVGAKTLDYTVESRMVPMEQLANLNALSHSAGALLEAVIQKTVTPEDAASTLEQKLDAGRKDWDSYLSTDMFGEEITEVPLAKEPVARAFSVMADEIKRLRGGNLAGLPEYRQATVVPTVEAVRVHINKLLHAQVDNTAVDSKNASEAYHHTMMVVAVSVALALALSLGIVFVIVRNTMRTLGADPKDVNVVASRIAGGDLLFDLSPDQGDADSLMGRLREMKASLLHSKLDYEGQINAIGNVQAVIEFTPDGVITGANDNFLKVMGYTLEEIKGKHHRLFVDPADRDSIEYRNFWETLGRGQAFNGQFRRVGKNGNTVWVQGIYSPILDVNGKPFKVVKYATDITEARMAAALNAAFKGALDKVGANVVVANNEFEVIYVNEAGNRLMANAQGDLRQELHGLDAARLVGSSLDVLLKNPAQQRQLYANLSGTHSDESVIGGRTLRVTANPMRDDTGRRLGTVLEWVDRTAEVRTEVEVQGMVQAVTDGELGKRIGMDGKSGFFENLSKGLNGLVGTIDAVVKDVQSLVQAANDGDLTKRIPVEGAPGLQVKIGSGINDLTENMAGLISQVKEAAQEVNRGADEISQGNTNLSQRTEEQASSLEETASSMEEMTSTVKQNADNAGQANQLAIAARDQAEKGGAVVTKAMAAMSEINDASKKIADIIGVIDEIAFQTNLLALNAAVEAARAGEQGRGFAVVASEVRNLAGRSATAAKEIKALIQDSVKKVDEGSGLVTQSGATLEQIVSAVKKVTDIVAEIAAASQEQSAGIEQVNKAVMQLDELTQQNAALVEEASAASQSMADQARGLNETMARYRVSNAAAPGGRVTPIHAGASPSAARFRSATPGTTARAAKPVRAIAAVSVKKSATADEVWSEF